MADQGASRGVKSLLKAARLRVTRPREVIAQVLIEARDHPDADQVLARARARDASISQATTYRTLAALVDTGLLVTHHFDGAAARYELSNRPHHDHLIDLESGHIQEFVSDEIEQLQRRIARDLGYEIVAHRLELYCRKIPCP